MSNTFAQPWVCISRYLSNAERKPKLLLKSENTVEFKITTRKLELRKGDVIDIFYAYYNFAKSPVWIYDIVELMVYDEANKRLGIRSSSDDITHPKGFLISASEFILVDPQRYEAKHLQYFIGCEDAPKTWAKPSTSLRTRFENNQFNNTIIDCIDITDSKKIFVSLETENHGAVVVSPPKSKKNANVMPQFPTVTGNMKSNVLEISILEK